MVSNLHERIRVGAVFEHGGIRPVWLDFKGDKIKILKIFYKWKEKAKEGSRFIFKFSVYDGASVYEISFDPYELVWQLNAIDESSFSIDNF